MHGHRLFHLGGHKQTLGPNRNKTTVMSQVPFYDSHANMIYDLCSKEARVEELLKIHWDERVLILVFGACIAVCFGMWSCVAIYGQTSWFRWYPSVARANLMLVRARRLTSGFCN